MILVLKRGIFHDLNDNISHFFAQKEFLRECLLKIKGGAGVRRQNDLKVSLPRGIIQSIESRHLAANLSAFQVHCI